MRIPFVSGRSGQDKADRTGLENRVPAWIDQVPRVGWPIVAVIAMIMCAPGEHYLAKLAGYTNRIFGVELAWGMPACLVAYAAIAASVATRRAKGSQGRKTAIVGAFLSLGAAMAAQPVSHMFVTGHWASSPSPVWIVWSVSVVPPLVVGHLMHMAASHTVRRRTVRPDTPAVPDLAGQVQETVDEALMTGIRLSSRTVPAPVPDKPFVLDSPAPVPDSPAVPDKVSFTKSRPVSGDVLKDKQNLSARALELARAGQDIETIKDILRTEFTGTDGQPPKPDSVRKAAQRALDKVS
jgi:hypothetical protein